MVRAKLPPAPSVARILAVLDPESARFLDDLLRRKDRDIETLTAEVARLRAESALFGKE